MKKKVTKKKTNLRVGVAAVVHLSEAPPDEDDGQLRHVGNVAVVLAEALAAVAAAIAVVAAPGTGSRAQPRKVPVIQSSAVHVAELDQPEAGVPAAVVVRTRRLAVQHCRARVHLRHYRQII